MTANIESIRQIEHSHWLWWCRDNCALQERDLGVANCLVCALEPQRAWAWACGPEWSCPPDHAMRGVAHHVRFDGCGHHVEILLPGELAS